MFKEYIAYLKDNPEKKWFRAKLFGWGWTPARWQGWLTIIIFAGLIGFNSALSLHDVQVEGVDRKFVIITILLIAALIFICIKTGERPRWQWGLPEKYKKQGDDEKKGE